MKRALLLLSLLAVPCVVTSCKDDAAPGTDTAAPDTSITTESPLDKMCKRMKAMSMSDEDVKIFRTAYEGDTTTLNNLKDGIHIDTYCTGAAAAGNKELVLQCLDKGADPDYGLAYAAWGGHMEIVKLLLDKGARPAAGLSGAAEDGHMEIVKLLLDKGADPDWGLRWAAEGGHTDIVQLMLDNGADPNAGLRHAAEGGHMEIVKLLLDKGATDLDSAYNSAESKGHTKCAKLIRAAMKKK